MGISIAEFRVAMETYGAERLSDRPGSRYDILVPCFAVGDYVFLHSGSYYIVQRGKEVPEETMDKAMAEFGEQHPGKDIFWWGETHSIKGILTLAAMLEGKYSKELVNELSNTTYKKLLENPLIQANVELPFESSQTPKMKKLCKKIITYDNIVNPFGSTADLKDPIEYLDRIGISISSKEGNKPYTQLSLIGKTSNANYHNDSNGWSYNINIDIKSVHISVGHYYTNGKDGQPIDEVIYLNYRTNSGSYEDYPDDIDLRISLKTGLAWKTYQAKQANPATDEQIDTMIKYLSKSINSIKRRILRHMINK